MLFVEDDEELQPMSDEEFSTLEQEWNQAQSGAMLSTGRAGDQTPVNKSSSIPFYRRHQMITYIDQISRELKRENEK